MLAGRLEYFESYHSMYHFMACATSYERCSSSRQGHMFPLFLRPLHGLTPLPTNNSLSRKEKVLQDLRKTRSAKGSFCTDQNSHVFFTNSQYLYSKCALAIVFSLCILTDNFPLGYLISWTTEFLSTTTDEVMTSWQRLI